MEKKIDEAAVWRRVTAASAPALEEKQAAPSQEVGLMSAIYTGEILAAAYDALGNRGRSLHARLAKEQLAENRTLKSLWFLSTGKVLPTSENTYRRDPKESYTARLRWLLELQGGQQEALEALAKESAGRQASLLGDLALDAALRWRELLDELGKELERP